MIRWHRHQHGPAVHGHKLADAEQQHDHPAEGLGEVLEFGAIERQL